MSLDLTRFDQPALLQCARVLHDATAHCESMEAVAIAICRELYRELVTPDGDPASALVRCYVTRRFDALPDELQRVGRRALGAVSIAPPEPSMRSLVLLGTSGLEPGWNDRRQSRGHQVIPLPSPYIVQRAPMVARLVRELGVDVAKLTQGASSVEADPRRSFGVFHVDNAEGSLYIPAQQEFVVKYGVRSVVGFGGSLTGGDIFAIIIFARVPIDVATADRFRGLGPELKEAFRSAGERQFLSA